MKMEWRFFKDMANKRSLYIQYEECVRDYHLWMHVNGLNVESVLQKGGKDAQDFEDNYKSAANKDPIPTVQTDKSEGDFDTVVTHNICDKTTWVAGTTDSTWTLTPAAGEKLKVIKAEVQYIHDLHLADTGNASELHLNYYVWHPISPGTPVLGKSIVFDTKHKIYELGNEHYHSPDQPGISGGLSTVVFSYAHKLIFYGDETHGQLAYLEIKMKDHVEPTGSYATVGFVTETEAL